MTPTELMDEKDSDGNPDALSEAVNRIINRTPEQKQADREALLKRARKGRPLPEGKTLEDVLVGQWPGDETDEQILKALDELS
ncbi:MAG: hypothetical protein KF873_01700 [Gemmataceae bacterium]|jgi:hypothetical protein|nr:hypothetical protein [Planctomycetia bacterium]MBX3397430.1 hypothetical protein [Gemmataceae bacterium]